MTRRIMGTFLGLVVAVSVFFTAAASAATVTSTFKGQYGKTGMGCLQLLTVNVGEGENCMYNGGPIINVPFISPAPYPYGENTGPYGQVQYYDSDAGALVLDPTTGDPLPGQKQDPFSTQFKAKPFDGKIHQVVTGSFTIDDNGTATPTDDKISFDITLRSPGTGSVIRNLGSTNTAAEDRYLTMRQVLSPYKVDSATSNAFGGYTYVIGSAGFPTRIAYNTPYDSDVNEPATLSPTNPNGPAGELGPNACNYNPNGTGDGKNLINHPAIDPATIGDPTGLFGDMECGPAFSSPFILDPVRWTPWSSPASGRPGISRMEGNIGARSVGTVTGAQCVDTGTNNACKVSKVSFAPLTIGPNNTVAGGTAAEDTGWDDVYLRVTTDAGGKVIGVEAYTTQEYQVFGNQGYCGPDYPFLTATNPNQNCNSWIGEYFDGSGIVARNDNLGNVTAGSSGNIDVYANDQGFTAPVTVTILTNGTRGTASVNAGTTTVVYAATAGQSGADSFVYRVTDSATPTPHTDTATVRVNVLSVQGAQPDSATTTPATPVNISVGANDSTGTGNGTVTIDNTSFSSGGSAIVTAGNGGPLGGIVVQYTPSSTTPPGAGLTPPYTETFEYTLDDGASAPTRATVSVYLDIVPVALTTTVAMSTQGQDPLGLQVAFDPRANGGSLGNEQGSSTLVVTANGARGTATVNDVTKIITYTITDATFFHDTDQFTYRITDADGQVASGTVTINIPNLVPAITLPPLAADQDHASTLLAIQSQVTFGNGGSRTNHPVTVTTQALHGTCAIVKADGDTYPPNATSGLVYTPDPGFFGEDSCTITVKDYDQQAASATTTITVNPVITVTPHIGGAGVDPWTLLLTALAPVLARLRRRVGRPLSRYARLARLALLAPLLGLGAQAYGQAQDNAPAEKPAGPVVGEIVVTARKVEEKLKDVPLAITAFSEEQIQAAGIQSLSDVANFTPGLSFFNAFGGQLPVPIIRGGVPTDIFGENNTALFVDGVYVAGREGVDFSQLDVANIEVVKGPQTAAYGRNAFFGAVNFITKRPSSEFEAKATATGGNAGILKGSLSISGPLLGDWLGDTLRGRIAASYDNYDGTYSNAVTGGNDVGGHLYHSYQASLEWLPVQSLDAYLTYYHSNDRIDEPSMVGLPANCEDKVEPPAGIPAESGLPNIVPTPGVRLLNFCGEIPGIRSVPGQNGGTLIPHIREAIGEERQLDRASLRVDFTPGDWGTLTSLTGFSDTKDGTYSDFGRNLGYNQPFLYCTPASSEALGTPNSCLDANQQATPANNVFFAGTLNHNRGTDTTEFSEELRFNSPTNQRLRYRASASWFHNQAVSQEGSLLTVCDSQAYGTNTGCVPANYGLAPFDASAPNFAIGTAIFAGTLVRTCPTCFYANGDPAVDGGADPLDRARGKEFRDGWKVSFSTDFDIVERLTWGAEVGFTPEHRSVQVLKYSANCTNGSPACGYNLGNTAPIWLDASGNCVDGANVRAIGSCSASASTRYNLLTGRTSLKFVLTDDWNVYGSIAYGKKPGGVNLVGGTVVCPDSNGPKACDSAVAAEGGQKTIPTITPNPFKPETVIAYELGLKGSAFDRRATAELAVFYNDWKDIVTRQILSVDPVTGLGYSQPTAFNVNSGTAHVYGLEASSNIAVTEHLSSQLTFGWTHATLVDGQLATLNLFPSYRGNCGAQPSDPTQLRAWWNNCLLASGDVSGNTLLRQPEFKASAAATYQHPLVGAWDWRARLDATYQSSVYVGLDNESWLPAHTYVNLQLETSSPKYLLRFWVKNLLNNGGAVAAFRDIYFANTPNLYPPYTNQGPRPNFDYFVPYRYTVTYPDERTLGVTAEIRFGGAIK